MLYDKAKELKNDINDIKNLTATMIDADSIQYMDERTFKMTQKTFKMVDDFAEFLFELSASIDDINTKLDGLKK